MSNPSPSSSEGSPQIPNTLRRNILSYLTKISHGSAPFISTFLLIHLTAPALANLGGSSLASQTMLLGREYYQTSFGEKYLVLAPIAAHSLAGIAKRIFSGQKTPPRPISTLLSWTGYLTVLFFLPTHYLTHRIFPTISEPPISAVGPSELDYEFVKVGLTNWPVTSWVLYTGLVGSVALHMVDGTTIIWNKWIGDTGAAAPSRNPSGSSFRTRRQAKLVAVGLGLVLPVLSGLYVLSKEPPMIFASMARRFEVVFTRFPLYRI
ncbi:hypothetical protein Hypma_008613 [Hypsizygus marmoreus]|uniref:Mitochondrial adapter protein MCP1 transmembrane domain-containing protein n=1 Tax=Hypsizygus marmoreus TaxID=39966 RepID=A0A369JUX2_HYPMA|nr:hypothetical protein Hypma_008613 [Hypsizygus marmoreus]